MNGSSRRAKAGRTGRLWSNIAEGGRTARQRGARPRGGRHFARRACSVAPHPRHCRLSACVARCEVCGDPRLDRRRLWHGTDGRGRKFGTRCRGRGKAGGDARQTKCGGAIGIGSSGTCRPTFGLPADVQGRPQLAAVLDAWQKGRGRLKSYDVYVTFEAVHNVRQEARKTPVLAGPSFEIVGPPAAEVCLTRLGGRLASLSPSIRRSGRTSGSGSCRNSRAGFGRKFSREMQSGEKLRDRRAGRQTGRKAGLHGLGLGGRAGQM